MHLGQPGLSGLRQTATLISLAALIPLLPSAAQAQSAKVAVVATVVEIRATRPALALARSMVREGKSGVRRTDMAVVAVERRKAVRVVVEVL